MIGFSDLPLLLSFTGPPDRVLFLFCFFFSAGFFPFLNFILK